MMFPKDLPVYIPGDVAQGVPNFSPVVQTMAG